MLITVLMAVVIINVLVLTHELGHLLAAKLRGITAEIFSIGFGPKLFSFNYGGTEYRFSLFLFGGYVKFKGDELDKDNRNIPGGFYSSSPLNRIAVCVAGGFFNIVFACILYMVIFINGKPVTADSLNTIVGEVRPGSPAEQADIKPGDKIVKIDGKIITTWEQIIQSIAFSRKERVLLEIKRSGSLFKKEVLLKADLKTGVRQLGIYGKETVIIEGVIKNSPAEKAGLLKNDKILAVNGEDVFRVQSLIEKIRQSEGKELKLTIWQNGLRRDISAVPSRLEGQEYAAIGFIPGTSWTVIYPTPLEQFWHDLKLAGYTIAGLFTRKVPLKAMSGPVGIIGIIGLSAQIGWIPLLSIVALISLNLGVVNLLPIPVLDGGHIMFNIWEALSKRPLNIKIIEKVQNVFMTLLIAFFLYVTYNDVLRWFGK